MNQIEIGVVAHISIHIFQCRYLYADICMMYLNADILIIKEDIVVRTCCCLKTMQIRFVNISECGIVMMWTLLHWLHIVPGMTVKRFFGTFCVQTLKKKKF